MIRVTVEILLGGYAEGRRTIGHMFIASISDLTPQSDYRIDITEGDNPLTRAKARTLTVYVRNHARARSVWSLIGAGIAEALKAGF
ncbi:hypothetical protein EDE08_103108 [Bradyrhizobium sp. R2.2-H]|nr:hypothetical protein EDE10_103107 [Bradyrhizobium sp. Y-H1]TCU77661.1 hypothetical protein EDE08_103108 [Bradyrhizobium sp. R2.2-H]